MNFELSGTLTSSKQAKNFSYAEISEIDLRQVKATLVVMHNGRSGAHLFSNLMDNHSEILSCPPDSLQWIVENIHSESFLEIRGKGLIHKNLINWIISNCPFLFKPQSKKIFETLAPVRTDLSGLTVDNKMLVELDSFGIIAEQLILVHLKRYKNELKASDIFSLIHWAYALARGRSISTNTPVICWQRHNFIHPDSLSTLLNSTINPILVATVRQFEDCLDSFFSWLEPHYKTKAEMFRVVIACLTFNLNKRQKVFPEWAIKFEDMHLNTKSLMKSICYRLGIGFESTLLETTLDGHPCIWNVRNELITGTNKNLKRREKLTFLSNADVIFINLLFARFYKQYNYDFNPATLEFVNCDPATLHTNDLVEYLAAIQDSKKSFFANLTFEAAPNHISNLNQILKHTWNPALPPLELIF